MVLQTNATDQAILRFRARHEGESCAGEREAQMLCSSRRIVSSLVLDIL